MSSRGSTSVSPYNPYHTPAEFFRDPKSCRSKPELEEQLLACRLTGCGVSSSPLVAYNIANDNNRLLHRHDESDSHQPNQMEDILNFHVYSGKDSCRHSQS